MQLFSPVDMVTPFSNEKYTENTHWMLEREKKSGRGWIHCVYRQDIVHFNDRQKKIAHFLGDLHNLLVNCTLFSCPHNARHIMIINTLFKGTLTPSLKFRFIIKIMVNLWKLKTYNYLKSSIYLWNMQKSVV